MANQLKMAEIHAILTLHARGWSYRRIGRELGIHRDTAARYVRLAGALSEPSLGAVFEQDRAEVSAGADSQNRPNLPARVGGSKPAKPAHRVWACKFRSS